MCCVSVRYYNFYGSVVFVVLLSDFRIVTTARYLLCFCHILELLRQCDICCVSVRFQNCYDNVVCVVFLSDIIIFTIVWYLFCFCQILELFTTVSYLLCFCQILELLRQLVICCVSVRFQNCYDSSLFVVFLSDVRIVYDSLLFVVFLSD